MHRLYKIPFLVILCSLLVIFLNGQTAQEYFKQGIDAYKQGDLSAASEMFHKAVELDSINTEYTTALGISLLEGGNITKGIEVLKIAAFQAPDSTDVWQALYNGYDQITSDQPDEAQWKILDEALAFFMTACDRFPEKYITRLFYANLFFKLDLLEASKYQVNKAITLDPNNPAGYYLLGYIYYKSGDYDNAEIEFNKALTIEPDYPEALYLSGTIDVLKGDKENGAKKIKRSEELMLALSERTRGINIRLPFLTITSEEIALFWIIRIRLKKQVTKTFFLQYDQPQLVTLPLKNQKKNLKLWVREFEENEPFLIVRNPDRITMFENLLTQGQKIDFTGFSLEVEEITPGGIKVKLSVD